MRIIVDAMGGDNAPRAIVEGAYLAAVEDKDIRITLIGRQVEIEGILSELGSRVDRIDVINADEVISNDDSPTLAIRHKTQSSLIKGFDELMSSDDAGAFVSAGSTGAVLVGAFTKVGRISGVSRPALAPTLPTLKGNGVALCDCGANVDCKPENILHFALMASVYASATLSVENPRVGLLNNGAESKKGNALSKEAYELLKSQSSINFVGNCEARDILSGDFDVVVCDGFDGNIALKASEGAVGTVMKLIKDGVMSGGLGAKIGALLLKPVFKSIKSRVDYNEKGGACFLGVKKVVIKSHGSSKSTSIKASILQAKELAELRICDSIAEGISKLTVQSGEQK